MSCLPEQLLNNSLAARLAYVPVCKVFLHSGVSWVRGCAEAQPVVTLIPGSVEQRGQVFRTSHGDPPFCRLLFTLPVPQVKTHCCLSCLSECCGAMLSRQTSIAEFASLPLLRSLSLCQTRHQCSAYATTTASQPALKEGHSCGT